MEKNDEYLPLFETKAARGRILYCLYAISMLLAIASICVHRFTHFPSQEGLTRWAWILIILSELWYAVYWIITQIVRHRPCYRSTFKDRLSTRFGEDILPAIDIFVCTADAEVEPPIMVVNTVLSLMAYDYPPEKLHVYLSDDGASELMFYALLEASYFSRLWLPFCSKFGIQQPGPDNYFSTSILKTPNYDDDFSKEWFKLKKLYNEMKDRINGTRKLGRVADELRQQHRTFREWDLGATKSDHQTIFHILIGGRDAKSLDVEGKPLPTLVYLAREKRPGYPHHFKAGAMNALIRVSSQISNSPIILNVDCDQYSNNTESVKDALCFFMDEEQGNNIAYIQYPQYFDNTTKNDIYGNYLRVINEVEHPGLDANGGTLYIGSGCFHRRDVLYGRKYERESSDTKWIHKNEKVVKESEETCKILAGCSYEENSPWGREVGIKYGCAVEDVITGLSIKCKGWRSVSFNPKRRGFLGVAPTTLLETLIQHKRWSEGNCQIFLSKYCSFVYGHGKIPLKLQISYCCYNLWAANCLATLYYVIAPPFCLLRGINLFPQLSSPWVVPYAYVFIAKHSYSVGEFLWSGGTIKGWYNEQRMWLYRRVTSYLYGLHGAIMKSVGFSKLSFTITAKTVGDESWERYKQEMMEFDTDSSMLVIIVTIALFNLFALVAVIISSLDLYGLEMMLNGVVVTINFPVFQGLFLRKDKGRIPASVKYKSLIIAALAYLLATYY